ncbi:alpha-amylase family glycosyl hydrolase [Arcicella sp. LKC2W]|uniref:alpha-amylase family glycosyl hydrolase n=1 Tax=Arcicella sp. LKC2W TaxID=2984198 RepID=UPI002B21FCE7|nr:alpha-amylase family glycosyl hydrolase [Arcicella sp. LKC2W]MEA5457431.1 alpha-amylase family glycosyl hydrolase [Arcicella sp. LKC2W]
MQTNLSWASKAIFYHIYPLGLCDAPTHNDFHAQPVERLNKLYDWIPNIKNLGCNAVYLGPLFQSSQHGYDAADYYHVDKRLGTNETLKYFSEELQKNDIKLVLDGVFNHVGRDFWAFRDVQNNGQNSSYLDWFSGINFHKKSPFGDNFNYDCWSGHYNLVKLNLRNEEVKSHIFGAVAMWMDEFGIEGLRLDVAEVMDKDFLAELTKFCKQKKPDFWLMGEMIHGDYTQIAHENMLDSTTNYEAYKGLYSSHNDANYFEIAHTFSRQFSQNGIYQHLQLYNFVDNHDVTRINSILKKEAHLFPIYALLYTMVGIPSIYYGSEFGQKGKKKGADDSYLRPSLDVPQNHPPIFDFIKKLSDIRLSNVALQVGKYEQLYLTNQQFAFLRYTENDFNIIVVNSGEHQTSISMSVNLPEGTIMQDLLDPQNTVVVHNHKITIENMPACGARIFA